MAIPVAQVTKAMREAIEKNWHENAETNWNSPMKQTQLKREEIGGKIISTVLISGPNNYRYETRLLDNGHMVKMWRADNPRLAQMNHERACATARGSSESFARGSSESFGGTIFEPVQEVTKPEPVAPRDPFARELDID